MKKFEDIYVDYFDIVYRYLYCLTKNKDLAVKIINMVMSNCKKSLV